MANVFAVFSSHIHICLDKEKVHSQVSCIFLILQSHQRAYSRIIKYKCKIFLSESYTQNSKTICNQQGAVFSAYLSAAFEKHKCSMSQSEKMYGFVTHSCSFFKWMQQMPFSTTYSFYTQMKQQKKVIPIDEHYMLCILYIQVNTVSSVSNS